MKEKPSFVEAKIGNHISIMGCCLFKSISQGISYLPSRLVLERHTKMNLYLNYFKEVENTNSDAESIGIIIAAEKHELLVKYATGRPLTKNYFSKYQLYLPDQKAVE